MSTFLAQTQRLLSDFFLLVAINLAIHLKMYKKINFEL